jgi:hypothetical protein
MEFNILFIIKMLHISGIEKACFIIIEAIYNNLMDNTLMNWENLNTYSERSVTRQECLVFQIFFNITLETLAREIREKKKTKGHPN